MKSVQGDIGCEADGVFQKTFYNGALSLLLPNNIILHKETRRTQYVHTEVGVYPQVFSLFAKPSQNGLLALQLQLAHSHENSIDFKFQGVNYVS